MLQNGAASYKAIKRETQALEKRDREIRALREEMDNVSISDKCMTSSTIDKTELLDLRRTSERLLNDLEQKDEQLRQKDSALKEWDDS
jgi:succinate dehydrogenase/fumarate reductase flavoprotein subunit